VLAQLRGAGNAYAHQGLSPAQLVSQLNHFASNVSHGEFATTMVALFEPSGGRLSYSAAGHPPALLRRAETAEVIRLGDAAGPVLGPLDDVTYTEGCVHVRPGDVLVMYTDGLVEAADHGFEAGIDHLEQVMTSWSPDALLDVQALVREVAPRPHSDDVCLLVVRFMVLE